VEEEVEVRWAKVRFENYWGERKKKNKKKKTRNKKNHGQKSPYAHAGSEDDACSTIKMEPTQEETTLPLGRMW